MFYAADRKTKNFSPRIHSDSISLSEFSRIAGRLTEIYRHLKTAWDRLIPNLQCIAEKHMIDKDLMKIW